MCPRTEALLRRMFAVSITPNLTAGHLDRVIDGIRKAWQVVA
jgi:dTDP-4-amino-4,6-dideoxygalactose transaminase